MSATDFTDNTESVRAMAASLASGLSDAAVTRLRALGRWPEFESGRYAVVEEIGRGGMGTVYLALDEELGREVAIKIPNALASAGLERRLRNEARVLARLEHPGIVPIHDAGRLADGRLFYVMKRVRGRTLGEHLRDNPDLNERLRLFERICEPVAFAHAQGFIHRDLTPGNVMVGAFGEVMVMDWGVAKTVGSRQSAVGSHSLQSESAVPVETVVGSRQSQSTVRRTRRPGPTLAPSLAPQDSWHRNKRVGMFRRLTRGRTYTGWGLFCSFCSPTACPRAIRLAVCETRAFLDRSRPSARRRSLPSPRSAIQA